MKRNNKYLIALLGLSVIGLQNPAIASSDAKDRPGIETIQQQAQKTITGLLTDSNGDPVIGATIIVEGTTRGVTSDIDGRYSIKASVGETLEFRYIGFVTTTRRIDAETTTINVRMETDAVSLEDVVIVGYGQQKKESVVGAICPPVMP